MFESLGRGTAPEESEPAFSAPHPPHGEDAHSAVHAQIAQAAPSGEPIGAVVELTGSVTVTHADGSSETAAPGAPVFLDDTVTTGTGSSVEIQFVDGTRFSLGQDGQMVLDQLVYDPGGSSNELDLSVVQGAFTFVTGSIAGAPGEGMEVRVPVGTIGIRGTAVGAGPDTSTADPTDYTVVLLPEQGGRAGRIVLTDLFGRSVILDQALEAMDISSLGLAPGEPVQLTREQVIALLGLSIQNIEDILNEIENFEIEDSPEDDINPEAGPEQEGQLFDAVPNNGGIRTQLGETFTLGQLTSLFSLSDQQGLGGLGGQNGGFTPAGGLGGNQGNDDDPPQDQVPNSTGPDGTTDLPPDGNNNPPDGSGLILLTGGDGDDVLDASGFSGPTSITGLGGNDTLIGSAFDDILNGGDGNDTLNAGAGNDQVNGGAGNDLIIGGSGQGNDVLDGGSGIDTVTYSSATQAITVNLTTGVAFGDPAIGNDTLSNIENVIGGKGSDSITGDGANNVLYGGEGNDTLGGLGGDDTIIGGQGVDTAVFTGNYNDYIIEGGEGGYWIIDTRNGANDGTDFVADDVEILQFADKAVALSPQAVDDFHVVNEGQQSVTNGAALKTTVIVEAGAQLSLRYNFLDSEPAHYEATYKDFAVVTIGGQVFTLANVDDSETPIGNVSVQFDEQTGYLTFNFTFTESGQYDIGLAVVNEGDTAYDAGLLVDNVTLTGGIVNGDFENGLQGWTSLGNVGTVGAYGGIAPDGGAQQALLVSNGATASAIEQFLGLAPGSLSSAGNEPVASGNVLDNDGLHGAEVQVASVVYAGNADDVEDVNGTIQGSLVAFAAADGSWTMQFNLSTGAYVFTVHSALEHGSNNLFFPFTYTLEGLGSGSAATLTIVVNDGVPDAVADSATATEGGEPIGGNVLYNDGFSPDGAWVIAITIGGETYNIGIEPLSLETPLGGWLTIDQYGEWNYTPPESVPGSNPAIDSFTYVVTDGDGDEDSALVQITVEQSGGNTNEPPIAVDDSGFQVDIDSSILIEAADLLDNDSDPENDTLSIISVGDATIGDVELDIDGNVRYSADPYYSGPATFTYTVSDGNGNTSTATVSLTVVDSSQPTSELIDSNNAANTVNRENPNGKLVGITALATGPDFTGSVTYSLLDNAGGIFAIDATTGVVTMVNQDLLQTVTAQTVAITVRATSISGVSVDNTFDIAVTSASGTIDGDGEPNILYGTSGNDHIRGFAGNDQLYGLEGDDVLDGGHGDDILYGAEGNDQLFGGQGVDFLYGADGDDQLYGGADADYLWGGAGNDWIDGGTGDDTVYYLDQNLLHGVNVSLSGGIALDDGFGSTDTLVNVEHVFGSMYADTIGGDENSNYLYGDAGNDTLSGAGGNDNLIGGEGNDTLNGGDGNDYLFGGLGDDFLHGDAGDDYLFGDEGADSLFGGDGNDILYGTAGEDAMYGGAGSDTIMLDALADGGNAEIDGGDGFDTLFLLGGDLNLDLSNGFPITNVERLNITGTGDNSVSLTLQDVLESFNGTLEIFGNVGDSVISLGEGWGDPVETVQRSDGAMYDHYQVVTDFGTANLYVSTEINAAMIS